MKLLFVGDPHATVDSLPECERLVDFICEVAKEEHTQFIVLLGDLYHTHAVMRVEVMAFWRAAFERMTNAGPIVIALKGNHDMPGSDSEKAHALMAHKNQDKVWIVDDPMDFDGWLNFLPYYADRTKFVEAAKSFGLGLAPHGKVLVCHQSFLGFKYENGHVIEDGINPADLPQELVISGHIHSPQRDGKVWYIGAPRWRTASDVNTERNIWVVEFNKYGEEVYSRSFPTNVACSELICLEDRVEKPLPDLTITNDARVMIDIHGPQDWIEQRKGLYPLAHRIRTFRTDNRVIRVKESEGIEQAMQSYLEEYKPKRGTDKAVLAKMVQERVWR
jgi:DNA repair exonuclease SbcCD nuclease subunit